MFSVELKVNGALVAHVSGHNNGPVDITGGHYDYSYEYYEVGAGTGGEPRFESGTFIHKRSDGLAALVAGILAEVRG